jgi:hypothetical protein
MAADIVADAMPVLIVVGENRLTINTIVRIV